MFFKVKKKMTVSKEVVTEREVWRIPTEEVEIKVSGEETEEFIREQIKTVRELAGHFGSGEMNLAIIEEDKATLTSERRKDYPRILETKWIEEEAFLQVLSEVAGWKSKMIEKKEGIEESWEPPSSLTRRTFLGVAEIFPSWQLTEEDLIVVFIRSSQISFTNQVTSAEWNVVACQPPKRRRSLRDLFRKFPFI